MKDITVVICTYNRENILKETIPTILNQNVSNNIYDILIVNNNSVDNTHEIILEFSKKYDNLSFINEPNQGTSFARNTGIMNSESKWIIFLDDDAKVPESFIETAINIIDREKYDCFGGVYFPWYKKEKPKWFKDRYVSTAILFDKKNRSPQHRYISAGIMAIKKATLEKINGFPTNLGPRGRKMFYGEETYLHERLLQIRSSVGIESEWYMHHLVPKRKYHYKWFINNGFASGRDHWDIYSKNVTIKTLVKYFKNTFTTIFKNTKLLGQNDYYIQNWIAENLRISALELGRQISGIKILLTGNQSDK